jgi:hypothetical protein
MRLSIRQALAPMALLVTALASMGMAPVYPAPVAPTASSSCSSYIDWNTEKGVWRINCGESASCCEYDSIQIWDGSVTIWCDCSVDGVPPECCTALLHTFPENPTRSASPEAEGMCTYSCGAPAWASECALASVGSVHERGQGRSRAEVAECQGSVE